jgi:hypothetical protein
VKTRSEEAPPAHAAPGRLPSRPKLAWVPIPVLLVAMLALWAADLRTAYQLPLLQLALYGVTSTLVSLLIATLIGRSFLLQRKPGLLLLGCGVLF